MDHHQAETRKVPNDPLHFSRLLEIPGSSSSVSTELVKTYMKRKLLSGIKLNEQSFSMPCIANKPQASTADIMKIARAKLAQHASQNSDLFSSSISALVSHSGLSSEENEDVEVALLLQACAEKVAHKQFDRARKLLSMCDCCASKTGTSVQRVVYYFAEALKEKIGRETGEIPPGLEYDKRKFMDAEKLLHSQPAVVITLQNELPFSSVTQFTGIQAILDNVASVNRIHLIDLSIGSGSHWTIIMQALAVRNECPVEHLKITAVGTGRERIESTGQRLLSFAKTIKVPFQLSFKVIESDVKELREDLFELENGEAVAVFSDLRLWSLLAWPNHLESLLGVIENLNPCIMVVIESEVKTNSQPTFLDRFYSYLVYSSALFDCVSTCVGQDEQTRMTAEGVYLRQVIHNVVSSEGEERSHRHETIEFWRAIYARFGMVETKLSPWSLYQAGLILKRSPKWIHCSLETNGESLVINWKGVPIMSVSAYKFHQ